MRLRFVTTVVPFKSVLSSMISLASRIQTVSRRQLANCWLRLSYTSRLTSRKVVEEAAPLLLRFFFSEQRYNMYSSVMQTNSCHSNIYRFAGFCPKAKKPSGNKDHLFLFCFSSLWLNIFVFFFDYFNQSIVMKEARLWKHRLFT